ncbi:hypothetical protein A2U01_0015933, partial [Trifolium medium]|nr:hypothetical protein [Trifolium medium]
MDQKRAAEDEQDREFERLQKQNPNLEDRGIVTF